MNKEEIQAAKAAMKEIVNLLTPEQKAEIVKQFKEELFFGKKRLF